MNYLDGNSYFEINDQRYRIHPSENVPLRLRDELKSLGTRNQVQNETQIRENQKVNKNNNDELVVINYPKNKQPNIQQRKSNLPSCPSCKRKNWSELSKG